MRIVGTAIYNFWLVLYVFYMKVVKQYASFTSLHIYLQDTNVSTDIDFDTFWVLIYSTIC